MKIKFNNGVVKVCTAPTEQKASRNGALNTWILTFRLTGGSSSEELDALLVDDNISAMQLLSDSGSVLGSMTGYNTVVSCSIRYADDPSSMYAELQLMKSASTGLEE